MLNNKTRKNTRRQLSKTEQLIQAEMKNAKENLREQRHQEWIARQKKRDMKTTTKIRGYMYDPLWKKEHTNKVKSPVKQSVKLGRGIKKSKKRRYTTKIHRQQKGGLFRYVNKGYNVLKADPFKVKRNGRQEDLLDLMVTLDADKGHWRTLKRNLARLSIYDLDVPQNKIDNINDLFRKLKKRGIQL